MILVLPYKFIFPVKLRLKINDIDLQRELKSEKTIGFTTSFVKYLFDVSVMSHEVECTVQYHDK